MGLYSNISASWTEKLTSTFRILELPFLAAAKLSSSKVWPFMKSLILFLSLVLMALQKSRRVPI